MKYESDKKWFINKLIADAVLISWQSIDCIIFLPILRYSTV